MSFGRLGALGVGFGMKAGGLRIILLSNSSVLDTATVGTTIGTLSVSHGIGSYTFTLTNNAGGKYSISGSSLQVAASLADGVDTIVVHADNGAGSVLNATFLITVTGAQSEPFPIIF